MKFQPKAQPTDMPTIESDAEYQEALRVQSELSARNRAILQEIEKERQLLQADNVGDGGLKDSVSHALAMEPGQIDERKVKQPSRLAVLNLQAQQMHEALGAHADQMYVTRRSAGYRMFAIEDGGYQATADKLLETIDSVIALNKQLKQEYDALCARGCDHVQQVQFPTPQMAYDMARWREGVRASIEVLNDTAKRFAPK